MNLAIDFPFVLLVASEKISIRACWLILFCCNEYVDSALPLFNSDKCVQNEKQLNDTQ